jgi:hypothetical protein
MDQFSIGPGEQWEWEIQQAAVHCAVMLVLMGKTWLTVTGDDGRRRLEHDDDLVLREVTAALDRATTVIPVLVPGGTIPHWRDLPYELHGLEKLQALQLTPRHWEADTTTLIEATERAIRVAGA